MSNAQSPIIVFSVAGLCSGLCSGLSCGLPLTGLIIPGILFGTALSYATHTSLTPLSSGQRATLIVASTGGYFTAITVMHLSMKLPGFDNSSLFSSCAAAVAGGFGALVVAGALLFVILDLSIVTTLFVVTFVGAVFGSAFMFCGMYMRDFTSIGRPFHDIVSFSLWQASVASVVPFCRSRLAQTPT